MLAPEVLVVLAFATYRCARLVTRDSITDGFRDALYGWAWVDSGHGSEARAPWRTWAYEGLTCPLCIGVWTAGVLYLLWRWGGPTLRGLVVVLAVAGVQCGLALLEADPK